MDHARVTRLLAQRIDTPSLVHALDLYSRVHGNNAIADIAAGSSSNTSFSTRSTTNSNSTSSSTSTSGVEAASLLLLERFLEELKPTAEALEGIVTAADTLAESVNVAETSINASTSAAEEFIASVGGLRETAVSLRRELRAATRLVAKYAIHPQAVEALRNGPNENIGEFFKALEDLLKLKADLRLKLSAVEVGLAMETHSTPPALPPSTTTTTTSNGGNGGAAEASKNNDEISVSVAVKASSSSSSSSSNNNAAVLAILADQRGVCDVLETTAFDALFDWTLHACAQTEESLNSTTSATPNHKHSSARDATLTSSLRRAVTLFRRFRPAYLASCQQTFMNSRRAVFLRKFLTSIATSMSGLGNIGGGGGYDQTDGLGGVGRTGGGGMMASSALLRDLEAQLGELLAIVHGNLAEESVFIHAVFGGSSGGNSTDTNENGANENSENNNNNISGGNSTISAPQNGQSPVSSASNMLAEISSGIATPVSIRIGAVFEDLPALHAVFRNLDIVLFYTEKLGGLLQMPISSSATSTATTPPTTTPTSAGAPLLTVLEATTGRAKVRVDQLLALMVERIRSYPLSLPMKLVAASLAIDVCSELELMLEMSAGMLSGGKVVQYLPAAYCVQSLVTPLLEYCRASADGMDLLSMSIWMLNNASTIQTTLLPHPHTVDTVQMLAGEIAAWEESLVTGVADEVLRETGAFSCLNAFRNTPIPPPPVSNEQQQALPIPVPPEQLMMTLTSFVRRATAPSLLSSLDLVSHPKVRSRTRRDTCATLSAAFTRLREAASDEEKYGYMKNHPDVKGLLNTLPADLSLVLNP